MNVVIVIDCTIDNGVGEYSGRHLDLPIYRQLPHPVQSCRADVQSVCLRAAYFGVCANAFDLTPFDGMY
jgi:hypothetical protein